jgi:hypothetical protein
LPPVSIDHTNISAQHRMMSNGTISIKLQDKLLNAPAACFML